METREKSQSIPHLHPALWVAAISVTLFSLTGIAKLCGWLPDKKSTDPIVAASNTPISDPVTSVAPEANPRQLPAKKDIEDHLQSRANSRQHKISKKPTVPPPAIQPQQTELPPPLNSGVPPDYVPPPAPVPAQTVCLNCGVVESIREISREQPGTGVGAVMGGIAGGVLGSNVGKGSGRALATMAGIFGGAVLGDSVERSQHHTIIYRVFVRMDNGGINTVEVEDVSSLQVGDHIRLSGGRLARQ